MITEHPSPFPFTETLSRLTAAIQAAGMTIFATIDHAANARLAALEMPPTTVLIYGNPIGGTPLMLAAPNAALDLPLRVLIRQTPSGAAQIAFHPAALVLREAGLSANLAIRLDPAQNLLLKALT
jgi:uncharacterized protein (DUF302 family)